MYLVYNGVVLDVLKSDEISREAVYDESETQVLYYRWTIPVIATLNPKFTYGGGKSPVIADVQTRAKLLEPRKKLFLLSPSSQVPGGTLQNLTTLPKDATSNSIQPPFEVLLECPKAFGSGEAPHTDAKDGPTPLKLNIMQVDGVNTFHMRYVIRCHETPDPETSSAPPSPIASHKWRMHISSTDDYFMIRHIAGHVVFRQDMLEKYGLRPDDLRAWLMHPIPLGFKRSPPMQELSEDGTELFYEIEDVQQPNNFNPYDTGAVHIEIAESVTYAKGTNLAEQGKQVFNDLRSNLQSSAESVPRAIFGDENVNGFQNRSWFGG